MRTFLVSLLFAVTASAAPTITSISPATGTVGGGNIITIHGSGFPYCIICSPPPPPPAVLFGIWESPGVRADDTNTLEVIAPPLLPGTYDVTVVQFGESATLRQAYTVPAADLEPVLLPIFSPPVHGAFGSLFVTDARAFATTEHPVDVYGPFSICGSGVIPQPGVIDPLVITIAGGMEWHLATDCSEWPGRLLYVARSDAHNVTFNLRVTDTTRTASNLGTEIPVVRSNRMTNGKITLLNVPIDGRYRKTLRIYSTKPIVVYVTTVGQPQPIQLQPGRNIFEPAYAQFTDFPIPVDTQSGAPITVTIEQPLDIVAGPPMWAFITVTNNETQQITTITPDL